MLNVTPDSFSDGGRYHALDAALQRAQQMLAEGVDVIDVGGVSTRPRGTLYGAGADSVSLEQELERVVPVVQALRSRFDVRVSVDTVRAEVARQTAEAGAGIVNDVSNGADAGLLQVAAGHGMELVLMHTRGDGAVEPPNTSYGELVADVTAELLDAVERACAEGVPRQRIWIDPGIGFAKTSAQSLELLARTQELTATGLPVLVGPSRKGFIAEVAPQAGGTAPAPQQREGGTAAAVTAAVLGGARAVRVHEVAAMRQAVLVADAMARRGAA